MKGLLKAQVAFIGIELYLFFRKHVDIKEKIKGFPLFVYQTVWFSFFFFSVLITILYFTLTGLKLIPEPLLYILKSQEVTFVERLDLFFLYIWMIWTVITVTLVSFCRFVCPSAPCQRTSQKGHNHLACITCIVSFILFVKKLTVEKMNESHHLLTSLIQYYCSVYCHHYE